MPDPTLLVLANDCRERAEEILTKAEIFDDANAMERMRRIAASYKQLAERLEWAAES